MILFFLDFKRACFIPAFWEKGVLALLGLHLMHETVRFVHQTSTVSACLQSRKQNQPDSAHLLTNTTYPLINAGKLQVRNK